MITEYIQGTELRDRWGKTSRTGSWRILAVCLPAVCQQWHYSWILIWYTDSEENSTNI